MPEEPKFWNERYKVSHPSYWQGRSETEEREALRYHERVEIVDLKEGFAKEVKRSLNFGLAGFSCDVGVQRNFGRPGAVEGPTAIRRALAKLAVHLSVNCAVLDVGDVVCMDEDMEASQRGLAGVISRLHHEKIRPIVLGGGHEVAWGHFQGIVAARPMEQVGIINFDSHFDLRPMLDESKGTSGTSFAQIAKLRQEAELPFHYLCLGIQPLANTTRLCATAEQLGALSIAATDFHKNKTDTIAHTIDEFIDGCDSIYFSLCLDVFAAAFAPGVSSPQPTGLTPWQVIPWVEHIARSGKVVGFEVAELAPPLDRDGMTAALAAHVIACYMQSVEKTVSEKL